jgi:diguanylate cyclase (GGDEF)-like protein
VQDRPPVIARRWFVGVTALLTGAHLALPGVRPVTYLLVSAIAVIPLGWRLRKLARPDRLPWWILLFAMTMLTAGNAVTAVGGPSGRMAAELIITVAHASLLASAVTLVLRRGRNDIGGVLDVSVAAIALGGLLWTALLLPRLSDMGAAAGERIALLISVLVLAGVLGALVRVRAVAERRLPALDLLVVALIVALVGNVVLGVSTGSMTTGRPGPVELFFLVSYGCVGAAPLAGSVGELMRPGPAPVDDLSTGRLAFLGASMLVIPLAGGIRQMAGLPADGSLLALGSALIVPLVMIRVGRLAAERRRAEFALRHQATHDQLTGLPNRGELLTRLQAALAAERRTGRPSVVLLFCDLNGFKAVNDRLGHLAGDRLLTEVGARIAGGLRVGETLARYGGDEFLVLCADDAPQEAARRLREHIEHVMAEPFALLGDLRVGAAVGAVQSDGRSDADELIRRADQAMYAAKQASRAALR